MEHPTSSHVIDRQKKRVSWTVFLSFRGPPAVSVVFPLQNDLRDYIRVHRASRETNLVLTTRRASRSHSSVVAVDRRRSCVHSFCLYYGA